MLTAKVTASRMARGVRLKFDIRPPRAVNPVGSGTLQVSKDTYRTLKKFLTEANAFSRVMRFEFNERGLESATNSPPRSSQPDSDPDHPLQNPTGSPTIPAPARPNS